jgi:hypothetical protein
VGTLLLLTRIKRAFTNNTPGELAAKTIRLGWSYLKRYPERISKYKTACIADAVIGVRIWILKRRHATQVGHFVHLRDLKPISDEQWHSAREAGAKISSLRNGRGAAIRAKDLDPAIAMPGGYWTIGGAMPVFPLFDLVEKGDYSTINNLRLFSYSFSGFYLAHLAVAQGANGLSPPEIDESLFARLDQRAQKPPSFTVLEYCEMIRHVPAELRVSLPKMLGEIGWDVSGTVVNTDTRNSQTRMNVFYETGVINWLQRRLLQNGFLTVMDIGSGVGDVCYSLSKAFSSCRFILCDLPESLIFSATYLRLVMPNAKHVVMGVDSNNPFDEEPEGLEFVYVPNYLFCDLAKVRIDFVYNFGSFEEMSAQQVKHYGDGIRVMIGSDGIALDTNEVYGCNSKQILAKCLPYRLSPIIKTVIGKNSVDVWSNQPIDSAFNEEDYPLKDYGNNLYWRFRQRMIMAGYLVPILFAD